MRIAAGLGAILQIVIDAGVEVGDQLVHGGLMKGDAVGQPQDLADEDAVPGVEFNTGPVAFVEQRIGDGMTPNSTNHRASSST